MAKSVSIRAKLAMGSNTAQMGQMSGAAGALKMLAASLTNFSAEMGSAAQKSGFVTVIETVWTDQTRKIVKVSQAPSASHHLQRCTADTFPKPAPQQLAGSSCTASAPDLNAHRSSRR